MTKTSLALITAFGTLAAVVSPAQAAEPYSESPSIARAVRSAGGYDVVVGGAKRATIKVSDPAVFHGTSLAYVDAESVYVDGKPVGRLTGRAPELLGFTSDGTGLLAVQPLPQRGVEQ